MNEKAEQILVDMLQKFTNGLDRSADFLAGEVPEVVSQLLIYHAVRSSIIFLLGAALAIFLYKATFWAAAKIRSGRDDYFFCIIPGLVLAFLSVLFISELFTVLQIALAPKIYLIEYAASLVK